MWQVNKGGNVAGIGGKACRLGIKGRGAIDQLREYWMSREGSAKPCEVEVKVFK